MSFSSLTFYVHYLVTAANAFPYPANSDLSGGSSTNTVRPRVKPFHFDTNLIDGKPARVFCHISEGTPVSFHWLKDGAQLNYSPASSSTKDYSTLAIARVNRRRDNGNYSCVASNANGNDQSSSILNVQGQYLLFAKFFCTFFTVNLKYTSLL